MGVKFKEGQSGNPGGRPKLPPEIKEISKQTKPAIIEAYWKISNIDPKKAQNFKPKTLLEAGILKCMADFIKTGKTSEVSRIWAECHGKPRESIELGGSILARVRYERVETEKNED
jgi:hypothetical protein